VSRGDIEAKLREIKDVAERTTEPAADVGRNALIGGLVVLVVLAFLFGRRRGRKRSTIVEIRRI
jgi:MYXO-CTERM domain-containing protein